MTGDSKKHAPTGASASHDATDARRTVEFTSAALGRMRSDPFLRFDPSHVAERAYFRWLEGAPGGADEHWFKAEQLEVFTQAKERLVFTSSDRNGIVPGVFYEHYEFVTSWHCGDNAPRTLLGPSDPQICAICGLGRPHRTFKHEAHVVPEMFGCRNLLSNEECDDCNLRSGTTWETELGALTLGARAFSGVRAKGGGTPKIKAGGSFIGGGTVIGGTSVTSADRELFRITGPQRAEVEVPHQPARPAKAATAIAKMAWLMLSGEERERHRGIRSLLCDEVSHRTQLYELWIGRRIPTTVAIWERVGDGDLAELIAMLAFGHVVLLWAPPDWQTGSPRDLLMPPLPRGADHEGGLVARLFTGSGDDRTLGRTRTVQIAFEQYQRVHAKTPLPVDMVVREGSREARVSTFALSPTDATATNPHFCLSGGELVGQVEIRDQSGKGDWSWSYQAGSTEGDLNRTIAVLEGALRGGSVAVTSPVDHAVLCDGVLPPTPAADATQICQITRMAYYIGVINRRLGKEIALIDFSTDDLTLARWIAAGLTHGRFAQRTENGRFVVGLESSLIEHLATQLGGWGKDALISHGGDVQRPRDRDLSGADSVALVRGDARR